MSFRNLASGAVLLVTIICLLGVVRFTFYDQWDRFFWDKKNEYVYVIGKDQKQVCTANALCKKYDVPLSIIEDVISKPSSFRIEEKDGKLDVIYRGKTVKDYDGSYKMECRTTMSYPKR